MENIFNLSEKVLSLSENALLRVKNKFDEIDKITEFNQNKVLKAFIDNGVSEASFTASTGYGYGDRGRETIEAAFAQIVGAEDSLFRHNFVSGTHTISVALFGMLRPGDVMLSVTGRPYDTLLGVLGVSEGEGSLKEFGVEFEEIDLINNAFDFEQIEKRLKASFVKVAYIQRSRGYSLRNSLTVEEIAEVTRFVKKISPDTIVMVDNCYGEFVQTTEPTQHGADLIMGSLIKNPGGGIAPTGGYIAGRKDLIEKCACRLTAPGIGKEVGATLGHSRQLFMGLFNAPHVTGEAVKTAVFASALFESLGFEVTPTVDETRADIIQAVVLRNPDALIAFCQGMQKGAPVDSFVTPEPWDMPGYDNQVIMAAGAFTLGASIELSADAPIREPYAAWMQGGLNFHSAKTGVLLGLESMIDKGVI
ncbi:MAG: methionine gamma-lyase family protein [Clostridia bacterium]|nr:methionine gamma-lyase family protein [Clostridia bacterium]